MEEVDGALPDCQTGTGCLIPSLGDSGARVLRIRGLLIDLHELVDAGTVISICGGMTRDELELLAEVNSWLAQQKNDGDDRRESQ